MLSKKFNDIIFIGLVVIVLAVVVTMRFILLGQYDDRIERTEANNARLETEIAVLERLVQDNRHELLPSMVEMYRYVPDRFEHSQLLYFVLAQMELSEIQNDQATNRQVSINQTPVSFPADTDLNALSNDVDIYRITISFNTASVSQLHDFLALMMDADQLFVVQYIDYEVPRDDSSLMTIRLDLLTFYEKP